MENSRTSFDILKELNLLRVENWESKYGMRFGRETERARFGDSLRFLQILPVGDKKTIVDYGSGPGHHSMALKVLGWQVLCVDYQKPKHSGLQWLHPDDVGGLPPVDAIWSHHCLEHIPNPVAMLIAWQKLLKPLGELFLTVPPVEPFMVAGHITAYTPALLLYHLAIAGFDCSDSKFCVENPGTKGWAHLRAWVKKSLVWQPDSYTGTVTLASLAEKNLFPPEVTANIRRSGEALGASALICRWPGLSGGGGLFISNIWKA